MDLSKYRNITNQFQDVRLVSLHTWKDASTIEPRDNGGPYLVAQEGFDPEDLTLTPTEFLLGKSGVWISTGHFFQLPLEQRRPEYVFGTAAQVIEVLGRLPGKVSILRVRPSTEVPADASSDDLSAAFAEGKKSAAKQ